MDVVGLWGARVSTFNEYIWVRSHCYEHVVAIRMGLAIGAKYMQGSMREKTSAA